VRLSALSRLPVTGVKCTLALGYLSEMSKVSPESLVLSQLSCIFLSCRSSSLLFLLTSFFFFLFTYFFFLISFFLFLFSYFFFLISFRFLFLFFSQVSDATVRSFLALSVRGQNEGQKAVQVDHLLAPYTGSLNSNVTTIHVVFTARYYGILYLII
jgi:hypothetical protein